MLEGRSIETVTNESKWLSDRDVLVIQCDFAAAREAWTVCRSLIGDTHRWPVFSSDWSEGLHLASGVPTEVEPSLDYRNSLTFRSIVQQSLEVGPWDNHQQVELQWWESTCFEFSLDPKASGAPTLAAAMSDLGEDATVQELEIWVLRWQLKHGQLDVESADDRLIEWRPSSNHGTAALVLLPVDESWESLTYIDWYSYREQQPLVRHFFARGRNDSEQKSGQSTCLILSWLSSGRQRTSKLLGFLRMNTYLWRGCQFPVGSATWITHALS